MKKHPFLLVTALTVALTANAQFRIQADGNIALNTNETVLSPVSLNCAGDTSFYMSYIGQHNAFRATTTAGCDMYNWANTLRANHLPTYKSANFYLSVNALARPYSSQPQSYGRGYGVYAAASNFTSGYNYGVYGRLEGTANGAAIYGTTTVDDFGTNTYGRYAGYFNGNVKIVGNVTVTGSVNAPLLTEGYEATNQQQRLGISANDMRTNESVSTKLAALDAVSYYKEKVEQVPVMRGDTLERQTPPTFIETQVDAKQHYALVVEQLERAFPDLVYEQEDGTKAVNYIEMIPLLVQSINELSTRLALVENADDSKAKKVAPASTSQVSELTATAAMLMQNTPNPFTERTTIRFTLPEGAQNVYIYIFDMAGKMQKQIPVDGSMQSVVINGYELSAGMYIYSLVVNGKEMDTKRMILSK